jgi:hypothetical protein
MAIRPVISRAVFRSQEHPTSCPPPVALRAPAPPKSPAPPAQGGDQTVALDRALAIHRAPAAAAFRRAPAAVAFHRAPAAVAFDRDPATVAFGRAPATVAFDRDPATVAFGRAPAALAFGRSPAAIALRRAIAAIAAACALAVVGPARAENPAAVPDPTAQALFQDGRDLVDKGQWDAGCQKFEASMLLYPAASTLLNIARCYEHQSKLASAWSAYKRVQVLNRETLGDERKRAIDEMVDAAIKALTPRMPKIKLAMPHPPAGVTLRKDGEILPTAVVGTELPVDVGEHEIVAEAPGFRTFRQRFDVKESTLREVTIDLRPESEPDPREAPQIPTWAWASAGASLALFGLAGGFRVDQAFVEGRQSGLCRGDVLTGCPPAKDYDPAADNRRKNTDFGLFVGFGAAGAVALSAALIGIVRGPRPPDKAAPAAAVLVTRDSAAAVATFRF